MTDTAAFEPPLEKAAQDETDQFRPKFDANGLVTCVVTDAATGTLLMVAHMNAEALRKTVETRIAHYFSRSRNALWRKGDTSGTVQTVEEMHVDCDQDAVWIKVRVAGSGASCHTGRTSCFYRSVPLGDGAGSSGLVFDDAPASGEN
ncbi:phosphoribosyl-AMP cyclohydrolase [Amorphus orientalis]|uniref:Phosphoribosyl-AMP cyclohydrolase n=1 Tax=Amorphus orientalis TaxID=649198 RepID=A0AAE4ASX9_9HYPH|nr:phosphoribosyl-AMP cyclohydrolase [Amorphus orientalis]MDQ0315748.1 phosphoribosyl-AMP cyclohydrolase [Amorphus orientalis]